MIRELDAAATEVAVPALGSLLADAVAQGASVNFLAGFTQEAAEAFWRGHLPGLATGTTRLLVAEEGGVLMGTVLLFLATQPNAPFRAEIGKMIVHSSRRRRGIGHALLMAAEARAATLGRILLLLDTESGSAGDALYRAAGWVEYGRVPGHAYRPDGVLAETTMFYKSVIRAA